MNNPDHRPRGERCAPQGAHAERRAVVKRLLLPVALLSVAGPVPAQTSGTGSVRKPALPSAAERSAGSASATADLRAVAARYATVTRWGIFRKGERIGTHTIRFGFDGTELLVEVASSIRVTVLRIPVFRFDYNASERWLDGTLSSVDVQLEENGERTELALRSSDSDSRLTDADGASSGVPRLPFASNHWHAGALGSRRLYNTLTGKASAVTISPVGTDVLEATDRSRELPYTRYRYTGDVTLEAWYDDRQRWVGLDFRGEDGSRIEYRLEPAYR